MEQIGREFQKTWSADDLPPRLRELFADLEREWATAMVEINKTRIRVTAVDCA
jgi:hypothetical protein